MDRTPLKDEQGFTLIEVMVASLVLVTGMLAVLTCITQAQTITWSTQARTNGNALVREVIEGSRGVPYEQLVTPTLVSSLQHTAGLEDDQLATPGWQIRRGGFTYTVSVGVCAVDDARDGYGNHDAGIFCASGSTGTAPSACSNLLSITGLVGLPGAGVTAGAIVGLGDCGLDVDLDGQVDGLVALNATLCVGSCLSGGLDASPADAKRVVVLVRWDRGAGSRYVLQSTTAANPGLAGAPAITSISSSVSSPITTSGTTSLLLNGTTSISAATVAAYLDGTQQGAATGSGTAWSFTWPLGSVSGGSTPGTGEVVDGSYIVGLKAFDAGGQFGQSRSLTILVNRRAPYPPQDVRAGRNGSGIVDLEWQAGRERDIETYRGYRSTGGSWTLVCETKETSCQDTSAPVLGTPSYAVVAVDRSPGGSLREGTMSSTSTVPLLNSAPYPPSGLTATPSNGTTVLTWGASVGDPDIGDQVDHYQIYRDGALYADRYDRTGDASLQTWTDTHVGGQTHVYRVTAVDTHLAESTKLGPVTA